MTQDSYGQFCPVAMAAEILCTRWTIVVLRELVYGPARFNDLRRGVPRMSPALLSRRLKELESAGVIARKATKDPNVFEYSLTASGAELRPIIEGFGAWGQRWIEAEVSLRNLDAQLLMVDMRRNLDPGLFPLRRSTVHFLYPEQAAKMRSWWIVVDGRKSVDLCWVDPGLDVDLYVSTDLHTMTAIWMGHDTVQRARDSQRLHLTGDAMLADSMHAWLGLSPMAQVQRVAS